MKIVWDLIARVLALAAIVGGAFWVGKVKAQYHIPASALAWPAALMIGGGIVLGTLLFRHMDK